MTELAQQHEDHKQRLKRLRTEAEVIPVTILDTEPDGKPAKVERIVAVVCQHFGLSKIDLISRRRTLKLIIPRHITYYLCATLTLNSLPRIGQLLGGRDHTTILYAVNKVRKLVQQDAALNDLIAFLTRRIGGTDQTCNRPKNITPYQVHEIREAYKEGTSLPVIARKIGVSYGGVYRIIHRKAWLNVK